MGVRPLGIAFCDPVTQTRLFLGPSVLSASRWLEFAWFYPDRSAFIVARQSLSLTYPVWFTFPSKESCVYFEELGSYSKQLAGRWSLKMG